VGIGLAAFESDEERVAESGYCKSRLGAETLGQRSYLEPRSRTIASGRKT